MTPLRSAPETERKWKRRTISTPFSARTSRPSSSNAAGDQRAGSRRRAPGHQSEHTAIPHEEVGSGVSKLQTTAASAGACHVGLIAPLYVLAGASSEAMRWLAGGRRVDLQLKIPGRTNQGRAFVSQSLNRFDARHVRGHEVCQIEFKGKDICACSEQFRDMRDTQAASQPHDASIGLLNNADPALHNRSSRKTQATTRRTQNCRNMRLRPHASLWSALPARRPRRLRQFVNGYFTLGIAMVNPTRKVLPWNELFPPDPRDSGRSRVRLCRRVETAIVTSRADAEQPVLAIQIERTE